MSEPPGPDYSGGCEGRGRREARGSRGPASPLGTLLKQWRERRRMSQLSLALEAEISTRHLSFLETGRAQPSREMLLLLARTLEVPLVIDLVKGDTRLQFFTLLASLGTPYDITLHELRIECFFPADEATEQALVSRRPRS
jgi:transcriptional regulator with XRE-family HTH domain